MGPHPAVAEIRRAVRSVLAAQPGDTPQNTLLRGQRRALVACSGGADSLALAAAAAFEGPRFGVAAGLVTVDHGLQPDSAAQAARVAAFGYELGLDPVEVLPVDVGAAGGLENAARTARYAALSAAAEALDADVLLGHTLDDQAETVLLGLGRGSGPRSLAGMRVRNGRFLRPLLEVRRSTTQEACVALGLPFWDDPHNTDPDRQRARLRTEVLPLLEEVLQGGVAPALARTAALLQDDLDALDAMIVHLQQSRRPLAHEHPEVDVHALAGLPRALRTRALRAWARAQGAGELTASHTAALDALVTSWHGQGPVDLPAGLRVQRRSGRLHALRPSDPPEDPA